MATKRIVRVAGNRFEVKRFADGTYRVDGPERCVDLTDRAGAIDEIAAQVRGEEGDADDRAIARGALDETDI